MAGSEIMLPALTRKGNRRIYLLNWGGPTGPHRYRWECPTGCGFKTDEAEARDAQQAANAHECDSGWSAIRTTPERLAAV